MGICVTEEGDSKEKETTVMKGGKGTRALRRV